MHGAPSLWPERVVHLRFKGIPCGAISISIWIVLF